MRKKAHSIDMLFMLVLFAGFAIMSVLLIIIGSNVYNNITESKEISGNNRNVLSYVTNKIRTCQADNGVYIEDKDGTEVLVIVSSDGPEAYETLIFEHEGCLKEATIDAGDEYTLSFGDIIADVSDFDMELNSVTGMLEIQVVTEDESGCIQIYTGNKK